MTALLVSVRNATEAEEALAGGAAVIDVKEPSRGPMGRPDAAIAKDVVHVVGGRCPVSAALGDYPPDGDADLDWGVDFVKLGMANAGHLNWRDGLSRIRRVTQEYSNAGFVPVAYADWARAGAPPPYDVIEYTSREQYGAVLIDTWGKDGSTLLDWVDSADIARWCHAVRERGMKIALAGSLGQKQILTLRFVVP